LGPTFGFLKEFEACEKKESKQVRLTRAIYVELLASNTPTTEEINIFEQEQKSKKLEDKLEHRTF
jgi:hypothetical protein